MNYPLINDSIHSFKANEYGQRSIKLGDSAYQTFAAPVVPFFARPFEYVSPYLSKADSFGDKTLTRIDERFPAVKKPTSDLYNETKGLIMLPYTKGLEGRQHLSDIYSEECKKNGQQGLVGQGKAAIGTFLIISTESMNWLGSFLSTKKAEATQAVNSKAHQ